MPDVTPCSLVETGRLLGTHPDIPTLYASLWGRLSPSSDHPRPDSGSWFSRLSKSVTLWLILRDAGRPDCWQTHTVQYTASHRHTVCSKQHHTDTHCAVNSITQTHSVQQTASHRHTVCSTQHHTDTHCAAKSITQTHTVQQTASHRHTLCSKQHHTDTHCAAISITQTLTHCLLFSSIHYCSQHNLLFALYTSVYSVSFSSQYTLLFTMYTTL